MSFPVEKIQKYRTVNGCLEYEVKWQDHNETSWEPHKSVEHLEALKKFHRKCKSPPKNFFELEKIYGVKNTKKGPYFLVLDIIEIK